MKIIISILISGILFCADYQLCDDNDILAGRWSKRIDMNYNDEELPFYSFYLKEDGFVKSTKESKITLGPSFGRVGCGSEGSSLIALNFIELKSDLIVFNLMYNSKDGGSNNSTIFPILLNVISVQVKFNNLDRISYKITNKNGLISK